MLAHSWAIWHDGAMPNQHIHSPHAGSKLGNLAQWGYAQSTHTLTPCWLKVGRSGTMGLCPINTYTHSMLAQSWAIWHNEAMPNQHIHSLMLAQSWAIWHDGAMPNQHIHSLHAGSKLGDLARWGYAQSTHTQDKTTQSLFPKPKLWYRVKAWWNE